MKTRPPDPAASIFRTPTLVLLLCLTWLPLLSSTPARGGELGTSRYRVEKLATGLPSPWSLVFLGDDEYLVAGKFGWLLHLRGGAVVERFRFGEVAPTGQGGLMDLTKHPQYRQNGLIYYSYSGRLGRIGHGTVLARFRWHNGAVEDRRVLRRFVHTGHGGRHFGSRIVFDDKGHVYVSLGDRGEPHEAQELGNHKGTVVRLHADGRVPADNPFVNTPGAQPDIYSYGHRNPQGLVFDRGALWLHEHGPRGGDELNRVLPGANYGWPLISHGVNYSGTPVGTGRSAMAGMEQPLLYWVPSIAPSGLIRYRGHRFPRWRGDFFVGALAGRHLRRVIMRDDEVIGQEELLTDLNQRIREVRQDGAGYIHLLTDGGELLRLRP